MSQGDADFLPAALQQISVTLMLWMEKMQTRMLPSSV